MTTTPNEPVEPEPLPGLEDLTGHVLPPIEAGVRRTLAALAGRQAIGERDAGKTALAVSLAQVIHSKMMTGRLSTVGMDARILLDVLNDIAGEDAGADQALTDAMDAWTDVVHHEPV